MPHSSFSRVSCTPVVSIGASGFIRTIRTFLSLLRLPFNSFFSSPCGYTTLGF